MWTNLNWLPSKTDDQDHFGSHNTNLHKEQERTKKRVSAGLPSTDVGGGGDGVLRE